MELIQATVAVVGAGPAGVCAALAAARQGIQTILIGNRPVLGGNSSSEIRVWTRGAVGGGNFYAEEMGIWGILKLKNFYKNPDGNPIFWDETLLDTVLAQQNLELYLNTEISDLHMENGRVAYIEGCQQNTERKVRVKAKYYIDATGNGSLGAHAGIPFYLDRCRVEHERETGAGKPQFQGSSILYFTRKEDHPVRFIPPDYAYGMEKIEGILGHGGRVINEHCNGVDCWWFEYGGMQNTIRDAQEIMLELKRLVLGVWNYIKNSGKFDADNYTLEWLGSVLGTRESRRMESEYLLQEKDVRLGRRFDDGAFYGGWYMDFHPAGGMRDIDKEKCIQIPVSVYQIPLRCLYNRGVPNLIFAGRNIGTEKGAFVSSRVMNTCALAGQAAGTLAAVCAKKGRAPAELTGNQIESIRQALLREDMFIPGVPADDPYDIAKTAHVRASSVYSPAGCSNAGYYSLMRGGFIVFPGLGGREIRLKLHSSGAAELKGKLFVSMLPGRQTPGEPVKEVMWVLAGGDDEVRLCVPKNCHGKFCTIIFQPAPDIALALDSEERVGFLCGRGDEAEYKTPGLWYEGGAEADLYGPEQVVGGYTRPWGGPNQWRAARNDPAPWLELRWDKPVSLSEIRLYLDPDLNRELPSSRVRHWGESHFLVARTGMPPQLARNLRIEFEREDGKYEMVRRYEDNFQRLLVIPMEHSVRIRTLRVCIDAVWGTGGPALYAVRAYSEKR